MPGEAHAFYHNPATGEVGQIQLNAGDCVEIDSPEGEGRVKAVVEAFHHERRGEDIVETVDVVYGTETKWTEICPAMGDFVRLIARAEDAT